MWRATTSLSTRNGDDTALAGRRSTAVRMGKKGKRASSDGSSGGTDTSRRRSAAPAPDETLLQQRVAGPAVLPPPGPDGTGKSNKKRLELDLISKRVYQETILRCGHHVHIAVQRRRRKQIWGNHCFVIKESTECVCDRRCGNSENKS